MKCCGNCCEKTKELIEKMKAKDYTKTELLLIGTVVFLSGLILGMLMSPKGDRTIASFNGNNAGLDDFEEWEEIDD